jgi:hypothetical protein
MTWLLKTWGAGVLYNRLHCILCFLALRFWGTDGVEIPRISIGCWCVPYLKPGWPRPLPHGPSRFLCVNRRCSVHRAVMAQRKARGVGRGEGPVISRQVGLFYLYSPSSCSGRRTALSGRSVKNDLAAGPSTPFSYRLGVRHQPSSFWECERDDDVRETVT